jgi:hypothetical protein
MPVTECGCHIWIGALTRGDYGVLTVNGSARRAHRVAWEDKHGPIPEGMLVLHRCDMPPCINTDHLFLGSDADNANDMAKKQRRAGENHALSRLSREDVINIRSSIDPNRVLAETYGVSIGHIIQLKLRKRWRHI